MPDLFCYKMTSDNGFAPNPFWGLLTLATCKPLIRRCKEPQVWVAGFTSKELCGEAVGNEKLVYLMKVTEKISLRKYFADPRFKKKIPDLKRRRRIFHVGDNIYRPITETGYDISDFEQVPTKYHGDPGERRKDISGCWVLVSDTFFYFGKKALVIPPNLRPDIPRGQSPHGVRTRNKGLAQRFIEYVSKHKVGINGPPHCWGDDDSTWARKCC